MRALFIFQIIGGGGGHNCLFQSGNSRWQHSGNATINNVRIAVLFENKVHLKLFKTGVQ